MGGYGIRPYKQFYSKPVGVDPRVDPWLPNKIQYIKQYFHQNQIHNIISQSNFQTHTRLFCIPWADIESAPTNIHIHIIKYYNFIYSVGVDPVSTLGCTTKYNTQDTIFVKIKSVKGSCSPSSSHADRHWPLPSPSLRWRRS